LGARRDFLWLSSLNSGPTTRCRLSPPAVAPSLPGQDPATAPPRSDPATPHELIYPPIAIWSSEEGSVELELRVGPDGWVEDARILVSSGYMQLDAAALVTVGYWHYLPARQNGVPVASGKRVLLRFSLAGVSYGNRWKNKPPPVPDNLDVAPATDATHFLLYPQMARHRVLQGDVTLDVLVRADGNISDARVSKSSGYSQLDSAALISVGYWQYNPAIEAGRAVDAWKAVTVHFVPKDSQPESPAHDFTPTLPTIPGGSDNGTSQGR
jgi:TonB family protein